WRSYNPSTGIQLLASGKLYVRAAVLQDDIFETTSSAYETLKLVATNDAGQGAEGTGKIWDDGTGDIFDENSRNTTPKNSNDADYPDYLDDDRTITVTGRTVNEAAGTITFIATGAQGVFVSFDLIDGSAKEGQDFTGVLEISHDNGATWIAYTDDSAVQFTSSGKILVRTAVTNDDVFENGENLVLEATKLSNSTIKYANGIIVDDGNGGDDDGDGTDNAGDTAKDDDRPVFTVNDVTVNESAGTMTFTVTRTGKTALTSSVDFATSDDTAVVTADYTAKNGTLLFDADAVSTVSSKTVTVDITTDNILESDETFEINLSSPGDARIGDNLGVGKII
ncbi:MAG TPA: Calx-beta domain-containing protein, partial [Pseudomonadales bacterium]|nr:Calx-beta domain-containing protein [Pseudomonadales bacterium]